MWRPDKLSTRRWFTSTSILDEIWLAVECNIDMRSMRPANACPAAILNHIEYNMIHLEPSWIQYDIIVITQCIVQTLNKRQQMTVLTTRTVSRNNLRHFSDHFSEMEAFLQMWGLCLVKRQEWSTLLPFTMHSTKMENLERYQSNPYRTIVRLFYYHLKKENRKRKQKQK